MKFLKQHWIALTVIFFGLLLIYAIYKTITGIASSITSAITSPFRWLNPFNWFSSASSGTSSVQTAGASAAGASVGSGLLSWIETVPSITF